MPKNSLNQCSDLVVVDPVKLQWHMRRTSTCKSKFADQMDIGRSSLYRMLGGTAVRRSTVEFLAEQLQTSVQDLLTSTEVEFSPEEITSAWHDPEWEVIPETLMPLVPMSNGLVMRVAKVRHRVLPGEFGRGKVYDIRGMPSVVRHRCREALSRHATICRQLRDSPYIARNLTLSTSCDEGVWTSVDEWFESESLEQLLVRNPLPQKQLQTVMTAVAAAIETLHEHQIVGRELHPSRILVQNDARIVITDLELAKLLEVEGSVSDDWQRNHYRAPEVSAGESHPQADLFSFARIYLHAATGVSFEEDVNERGLLEELKLPSQLHKSLLSCLSPIWQDRPESISIIRALLNS